MKREIKFRGKSVDNNEWVYGDLIHIGNGCIIYQGSQSDYQITNKTGVAIELFDDEVSVVRPETLGQFTGLCDKDEKEIYEDDILMCEQHIALVLWNKELSTYALQFDFEKKVGMRPLGEWHAMTVISNIHDNPNLLKENNHE